MLPLHGKTEQWLFAGGPAGISTQRRLLYVSLPMLLGKYLKGVQEA